MSERFNKDWSRESRHRVGSAFDEYLRRRQEERQYLARLQEGGLPSDKRADVDEEETEHQGGGESVEQFEVAELPTEENEFVEEDPVMDEEMSFHERVVYYACFLEHFAFSDQEIECMERMMNIVYGMPPPIRYRSHVRPMIKDVLKKYDHEIYYFCNSCNGLLAGRVGLCANVGCSLNGVDVNRAKHSQRAEVHLLNAVPQLEDVISTHFSQLVGVHARIHDKETSLRTDRSDVRFFKQFVESVESVEEYENRHMKVMLTLSTDGFKPKRISRKEIWPLYLRIDDLETRQANNFMNTVLCGSIYHTRKPGEKLLDLLFSRLQIELHSLEENPIAIEYEGEVWRVSVALFRGVADMAAQNVLFGIPRWNSEFGCSKCLLRGTRFENQRLWIAEHRADVVLRRPDSYLNDGRLGVNGVPKATSAMRVLPPCVFSSDALHVCSEGLTRDRLRDLFTGDSRFPQLRVNNAIIGMLKQSLRRTKSHTYSNSLILSLEDLPICTASEMDEIAFIVFPLVAAIDAIPDQIAAMSLIGYWLCIRILASSWQLSEEKISAAQRTANVTKELWRALAPKIFTMKCHWFFDHAMQEELEQYGSPYQWSSAPFESHHRRLQFKINPSTTASSSVVINKFLLAKKLRLQVAEQSREGRAATHQLLSLIDNTYKTRFPVDVYISDDLYIPKYSEIAELQEEHRGYMRLQAGDIPYSRVVVRGTVFSSKIYWKRSSSSQQDMVYLSGISNGQPFDAFGNVIMFLYNSASNSIKVVLKEYETCDPFEQLGNRVNHFEHPQRRRALQLLRLISEHNSFFKQVLTSRVNVRSALDISAPCCIIKFGDVSYLSVL